MGLEVYSNRYTSYHVGTEILLMSMDHAVVMIINIVYFFKFSVGTGIFISSLSRTKKKVIWSKLGSLNYKPTVHDSISQPLYYGDTQ